MKKTLLLLTILVLLTVLSSCYSSHFLYTATEDLNAITVNFSPLSDRLGFNYYRLAPKGVGVYTGLSFYSYRSQKHDAVDGSYSYGGNGIDGNFHFNFDPDPTDSYSEPYSYEGRFTFSSFYGKFIAIPIGMTIKVASHSWLLAGLSIALGYEGYYIGKLEYSDIYGGPYKLYSDNAFVEKGYAYFGDFEAHVGANFAFNFIDLGVIANYDFMLERFDVDICAGVAL